MPYEMKITYGPRAKKTLKRFTPKEKSDLLETVKNQVNAFLVNGDKRYLTQR